MSNDSPVALDDAEMAAVFAAAHALPPERRSDFLATAAHVMAGLPDCNDVALHRRILTALQRRYLDR
jgi:hypothetical protein